MSITQSIWAGRARNYRQNSNGPVQSRKKYIVIHNTSNKASAEDEADYAQRRTDGVSSHYYVDKNSIRQTLDTDWCANHVGSSQGNVYGISYEITGTNSKSESWWLGNVAWSKLRDQIRHDCEEFGISPRALTIQQIKEGELTGIITHDQARRAWGHTTHTDPGPNFPMDMLTSVDPGPSPKPTPKPTQGWTERLMNNLPTVSPNDEGRAVKTVQALLNLDGAGLKEDGINGPKTTARVKWHQKRKNLTPDGHVGPKTWPTLLPV